MVNSNRAGPFNETGSDRCVFSGKFLFPVSNFDDFLYIMIHATDTSPHAVKTQPST